MSDYRMASPNPTQDNIAVEIDPDIAEIGLESVKLVGHGQNAVVRNFDMTKAKKNDHFNTNKNIEFDVSTLPRGLYHLIINFKGEKQFRESIWVN